jgi:copper/silver efflux system protein
MSTERPPGLFERSTGWCLENRLVIALLTAFLVVWGLVVLPFDIVPWGLPRDPVPVDAIPDLGENQQIVFTQWPGYSPRDVEDQVTYPLTTQLLGLPGVTSVRSTSMFGFSSIYVIFEEDVEFYWSRSRILEKLQSLPPGTLPDGVRPALGPEATALGQVFWYTLEGRDPDGRPAPGWDLDELRSIQDWYVRYALQSVPGVAEVASIGGYQKELQIDLDPDRMVAHGVTLEQVLRAVSSSNRDVGARTLEINSVEYIVRGLGLVESLDDLRGVAVTSRDGVPVTLDQVAELKFGPGWRRGALDKAGAEAVGGVVVARFGANPQQVIEQVKAKIEEIEPGLPRRVLPDGTQSQVQVVPFYDRAELIAETLDTLGRALRDQLLITLIVVVLMLGRLRAAATLASLLPLTVLGAFIAMKLAGITANVVALAGIAIAIGSVVDMGIVFIENVVQHLQAADPGTSRFEIIRRAGGEVGGAVATAVATTIVGFLPVFALEGAEGRLFKPLAWTKTFALLAAILITLTVLPPLSAMLLRGRPRTRWGRRLGRVEIGLGLVVALCGTVLLARTWEPLGAGAGWVRNLLFVVLVAGVLLLSFVVFALLYRRLLAACLRYKVVFLSVPLVLVLAGASVWLGFGNTFGWLPESSKQAFLARDLDEAFPGLGREFMPRLEEGAFLYMPVIMPHGSIGEALAVLQTMDQAIQAVPEVESVVGKIGRVDSALDPAPVAMIETVVHYRDEYRVDADGTRHRQWRDHVRSVEDIWDAVVEAAQVPGATSAPFLQPISARLAMLQSGMRAPMGVKVRGADLETIERVATRIESLLADVEGIRAETINADRIVAKPYLEIEVDRERAARFGLNVEDVQRVVSAAIGGVTPTRTVQGRERYAVRVRYLRELRDSVDAIRNVLVHPASASPGEPIAIPLGDVADIRIVRGPQAIKSEDTFQVAYVTFGKIEGAAEVDVVERARSYLERTLDPELPAGVSYAFAGSFEQQVRAQKRLNLVLPLALLAIFVLLYLQFRSAVTSTIVFSGVLVAWAGGFLMLWLYAQPWFLDVSLLGESLREVLGVQPIDLSVAVWVGFLALFGIATDDGVVMSTYIRQSMDRKRPCTEVDVREAVIEAGQRRLRPCLMTSATTILALLPVLTSTGKGAGVMVPVAVPVFGGMLLVLLSLLVVPVLQSAVEERRLRR